MEEKIFSVEYKKNIVMRTLGSIETVGEHYADIEAYKNLLTWDDAIFSILKELTTAAYKKDQIAHSVALVGEGADKLLLQIYETVFSYVKNSVDKEKISGDTAALNAIKKQKPMRIAHPIGAAGKEMTEIAYCFSCGQIVKDQLYCHKCGQRLDLEDDANGKQESQTLQNQKTKRTARDANAIHRAADTG